MPSQNDYSKMYKNTTKMIEVWPLIERDVGISNKYVTQ